MAAEASGRRSSPLFAAAEQQPPKTLSVQERMREQTLREVRQLADRSLEISYAHLKKCSCRVYRRTFRDNNPQFEKQSEAASLQCKKAFDGRHLAYMTFQTNRLVITDLREDRLVWKHTFDREETIKGLAFNGNKLALITTSHLKICDFSTQTIESSLEHTLSDFPVHGCTLLYQEDQVFVGLKKGGIVAIDLAEQSYTSFGGNRAEKTEVTALCISNNRLFVGYANGDIDSYDTRMYEYLSQFPHGEDGHSGAISSLTFFGDALVSAGYDAQEDEYRNWSFVKVWDLAAGKGERLTNQYDTAIGSEDEIVGLTPIISDHTLSYASSDHIADVFFVPPSPE